MNRSTTKAKVVRYRAGRAWLVALIPLVLIAGSAGVFLLFAEANREPGESAVDSDALQPGKDYYLLIRTIELYPTRPGGAAWDRLDGSGPDIQFSLTWQGNTIFTSQQRDDTLIGSWDALALDVKSAVLQGKVDLAGSIDAAIVRVEADKPVTLLVWDSDLAGSDEAGEIELDLSEMKLGDTAVEGPAMGTNAIKRVVVRVIDKALPVPELVEEAARP
ncbi:MAG: hypothetical protein ACPGYV_06025 [Phycisphaeraceae bacterium]